MEKQAQEAQYTPVVRAWMEQIEDSRFIDPEATLKCCNDLIEYATQNQDAALLGYAYFYCGEVYYCLNDGTHFYESMNRAVRYLDRGEQWELMARCYNFLGIKAVNSGNLPLALDYYSAGIRYCGEHRLTTMQALLNINLGGLFYICNRYEEAMKFLTLAEKLLDSVKDSEEYHGFMAALKCNRIKNMIGLGQYDLASGLAQEIHDQDWGYLTQQEREVVSCAEAVLYHNSAQLDKRDACIRSVGESISTNMAILDFFDDYYEFAQMLMNTEFEDVFWKVIEILETLTKNANSMDLLIRLVSLKIRFYRMKGNSAEYLQAAGFYYELSERREKETLAQVNNAIDLRQSLEAANEMRHEVELENRILMEKSEMDALTGLANRFKLNDFSEEAFNYAYIHETYLAVTILDVDYFKEFNDNYGHQAGDDCLRAVADSMRAVAMEHEGFCARYGGDEFVIIYQGVTPDQAFQYAGELKKTILAKNITHEYSKAIPQVTISQGVCVGIPKKNNRMWDFLHAADDKLYRIKKVSRNNYRVGDLSGQTDKAGETN